MAQRLKCRDNIDKMTDQTPSSQFTDRKSITSSKLEEPFVPAFADVPPPEDLPNVENDFTRAKAYLMKQCAESGDNLYDHLSELLNKILTERPRNVADMFEEYSRHLKEERFRQKTDRLQDVYVPPELYNLSHKLMDLLRSAPLDESELPEPPVDEEEEDLQLKPNLMELLYFFEQAGVGLPRSEMFAIAVALRKLGKTEGVQKVRFWGKLLGTKKNYIVAETELTEEELTKFNAEEEEKEEQARLEKQKEKDEKEKMKKEKLEEYLETAKQKEIDFAKERTAAVARALLEAAEAEGVEEIAIEEPKPFKQWPIIPPLPEPIVTEPVVVPKEIRGEGANKKVYHVINEPGDEWYRLPDVTPQQIVAARLIKRAITGDIQSPLKTYPKFDGTEENYLRAQIARISAATQISPLGFYTFNEEEEPEEEEEIEGFRMNFTENPAFEPLALKDLTDPTMSFWVHHTPYILKQGRTLYWSSELKNELGEEEEVGEEEKEEAEKEIGPPLLTPLSEDVAFEGLAPWSVRSTSALLPDLSLALVRSNLWPGAYAFATEKKFDNVYIGNGHKSTAFNFTPLPYGPIEEEYPLGPEIMEIKDPTPEEEEAWRKAHEKKPPPPEMPEGEEEQDEETESEDE